MAQQVKDPVLAPELLLALGAAKKKKKNSERAKHEFKQIELVRVNSDTHSFKEL